MQQWFECKVRYDKEDENGTQKMVTEPYLIDAVSFTEVEARIHKEMEAYISGEFWVTKINKTNLADVIPFEAGEYWYKCRVVYIDVDEKSGKEKKTNSYILLEADTVKEAYERLEENLSTLLVPYDILAITQTPIMEVFPYSSEEEIPDNLKPLSEVTEEDESAENL